MKRIAILVLALLTLALVSGCSSGDGGDGDAGNPTPKDLSGTWTGGGTHTDVSDGSHTNQDYTLRLNLTDSGGTLSGTFEYVRVYVNLRAAGSVTGTASGGTIHLAFPGTTLSLAGTYSGDTMAITLTESFTTGSPAWIRGAGSLTR